MLSTVGNVASGTRGRVNYGRRVARCCLTPSRRGRVPPPVLDWGREALPRGLSRSWGLRIGEPTAPHDGMCRSPGRCRRTPERGCAPTSSPASPWRRWPSRRPWPLPSRRTRCSGGRLRRAGTSTSAITRMPGSRPGGRVPHSGRLFFANAHFFKRRLWAAVDGAPKPVRDVVLDASFISDIDASTEVALREVIGGLGERNIELHVARATVELRRPLDEAAAVSNSCCVPRFAIWTCRGSQALPVAGS